MDVLVLRKRQPIYIAEWWSGGIEPAGGVVPRLSLSYATAFHRCEVCSYKPACREWLDSMLRSVTFAPRFCSNADTLFELQVSQPSLNRICDYGGPHAQPRK